MVELGGKIAKLVKARRGNPLIAGSSPIVDGGCFLYDL